MVWLLVHPGSGLVCSPELVTERLDHRVRQLDCWLQTSVVKPLRNYFFHALLFTLAEQ
jgi:hypothetical protein